MAKGNVPAPTRTDDQLNPVNARLSIGKRNLLMDFQKKHKNPIFLISLDILHNTNFFDVDLLRSALQISPKDPGHLFVAPPAVDSIIDFVNNLGYPEELQFVSKIPRHPIIQMLWGIVTGTSVDYAEFIWEEFVQSPLHIIADDYALGNLKFVPKGKLDEVFSMAIPKDLLTDVIRNAEYYQKYLEMATRKPRQPSAVTDEESVKKKTISPADKSKKPASRHSDDLGILSTTHRRSSNSYTCLRFHLKPPVVKEKGTGIATDEKAALSLLDLHKPKKKNAKTGADTEKSNSGADTEILDVAEEQGKDRRNRQDYGPTPTSLKIMFSVAGDGVASSTRRRHNPPRDGVTTFNNGVSCAKSSAVATQQSSSGNSFAITVAKCTSRGNTITRSGNALEHFIPNNPPINLMLHLQSSF
nr:histone deacetylase 14 [Tanacetum cinerariifolium]